MFRKDEDASHEYWRQLESVTIPVYLFPYSIAPNNKFISVIGAVAVLLPDPQQDHPAEVQVVLVA